MSKLSNVLVVTVTATAIAASSMALCAEPQPTEISAYIPPVSADRIDDYMLDYMTTQVVERLAEKKKAEEARIAAEQAAAAEAAAAEAAASAAVVQAPVQKVPLRSITAGYYAVGSGAGQPYIDLCDGLFTIIYYPEVNRNVMNAHNSCGGSFILGITMGQLIQVSGLGYDGMYQAVDSVDVPTRSSVFVLSGLGGDLFLQTCYFNSPTMRVVGLVKVG